MPACLHRCDWCWMLVRTAVITREPPLVPRGTLMATSSRGFLERLGAPSHPSSLRHRHHVPRRPRRSWASWERSFHSGKQRAVSLLATMQPPFSPLLGCHWTSSPTTREFLGAALVLQRWTREIQPAVLMLTLPASHGGESSRSLRLDGDGPIVIRACLSHSRGLGLRVSMRQREREGDSPDLPASLLGESYHCDTYGPLYGNCLYVTLHQRSAHAIVRRAEVVRCHSQRDTSDEPLRPSPTLVKARPVSPPELAKKAPGRGASPCRG